MTDTSQDSRIDVRILTHDTPPPLEVSDGSLTVESSRLLRRSAGGGRFKFIDDSANEVGHIRILQGNGDILYQDLTATGSEIILTLVRENGPQVGEIKIRTESVAGRVVLLIDSDRDLGATVRPHGRRKNRLSHPENDQSNFRINQISITKAGQHVFGVTAPRMSSGDNYSAEYRILVWPH